MLYNILSSHNILWIDFLISYIVLNKVDKMRKRKDIDYYIQNFRNYNERIPWDIFVKILISHYGCEMERKRGVARIFIKDEIRVTAHEPHGREKFVSKLDRQRVIKYLINKLDL